MTMTSLSKPKRIYQRLPDELALALMAEYPYFDNFQLSEKFNLTYRQVQRFAYRYKLRKNAAIISEGRSKFFKKFWNQKKSDSNFYSTEKAKHDKKGWYFRDREYIKVNGIFVRGPLRASWVQNFGPIPPKMAIWPKDWNRDNVAPENLLLVTRPELNCYVQAQKQPRELWDVYAALYLLRLRIKNSEQKQA